MKMKAALMYGPNDIRVEETDKPICPEDGLILKIMSVGLCGSDIRNLTTDSRKGNYPFIYGHEIVGFVDEVGAKQNKYKVGDRLFLFPGTYCMECDECISGHSENCSNTAVAKLAGTGGFAQYVAVSGEKSGAVEFMKFQMMYLLMQQVLANLLLPCLPVLKI